MKRRDSKQFAVRGRFIFLIVCSFGLVSAASASASAPTIESESVSGLTHTDATLEADINPGGLETHYQFRLAYGCGFGGEVCPQFCISGQPCPGPWNSIITVPLPSADLSASADVQHVSLDLNSVGVTLQPYKYRYSIEATNTEGTANGAAQYFTPPPASSPPPSSPSAPAIESESVSGLTPTDATLEAKINPHGLQTSYTLHLSTAPCGGAGVCFSMVEYPLPTETIPASFEPQTVGLDLNNTGVTLTPGFKYRYSVTATNTKGEVKGQLHEFEAPYPPPPTIESETVSNVTPTNATLEAEIDPQGAANGVFYQFQLLPDPGEAAMEIACPAFPPSGFSVCVGPSIPEALPLGWMPGNEAQTVSLDLASAGVALEPERTYFFRVLVASRILSEDTAEWEAPAVVGASEDFTTSPSPAEEDNSQVSPATGAGSQQTSDSSVQLIPKQGGQPRVHCKNRPHQGGQRHSKRSHRALRCIR